MLKTPSRVPTSTSTVRVRYAETDRMGVVYYANYFVWFEVARTDLLRTLGWSYLEMEAVGVRLPVIDAQCEYLRSATYDEEITIRTEGYVRSAVRMEFVYELVNAEGATMARGRTMHAAVDPAGRPCRLPSRVLEAFA